MPLPNLFPSTFAEPSIVNVAPSLTFKIADILSVSSKSRIVQPAPHELAFLLPFGHSPANSPLRIIRPLPLMVLSPLTTNGSSIFTSPLISITPDPSDCKKFLSFPGDVPVNPPQHTSNNAKRSTTAGIVNSHNFFFFLPASCAVFTVVVSLLNVTSPFLNILKISNIAP